MKDNRKEESHIKIVMKFKLEARNRIYDYFGYDSIIKTDEHAIYVQATFPEDEWVYSTILSFGELVEVIEPVELREKIIERIKKMNKVYNLK